MGPYGSKTFKKPLLLQIGLEFLKVFLFLTNTASKFKIFTTLISGEKRFCYVLS